MCFCLYDFVYASCNRGLRCCWCFLVVFGTFVLLLLSLLLLMLLLLILNSQPAFIRNIYADFPEAIINNLVQYYFNGIYCLNDILLQESKICC